MAAKTFEQFREEQAAAASAQEETELRQRFAAQAAAEKAAVQRRRQEKERTQREAELRRQLGALGEQVATVEGNMRSAALAVYALAEERVALQERISELSSQLPGRDPQADPTLSFPWGQTMSAIPASVASTWVKRVSLARQRGLSGTLEELTQPIG